MTAMRAKDRCGSFLRPGRTAERSGNRRNRSISAYSGHFDVKELGIKDCVLIDYACGAGHFLTTGIDEVCAIVGSEDKSWVEKKIFGVEKDYRLSRVSRIALFMHGAGDGQIVFGDGLENYPGKGITNSSFDILVSNPPYSVEAFKPYLKLRDNKLGILDYITSKGSEIETVFVERAAQLVRQGGYASLILPNNLLTKADKSYKAARDILISSFDIVAIARFAAGTFSAANVSVDVLFLRRDDEIPPRKDSSEDFVEAVFENRDLTGWLDKDCLDAYLELIECDESDYSAFLSRNRDWQDWDGIPHISAFYDEFSSSKELKKMRNSSAYKKADDNEKQRMENDAFYRYAIDDEKSRLYTYSLLYGKRTLVINSPDKKEDLYKFQGYKWSTTRGSEGIRFIPNSGVLYPTDGCEPNSITVAEIIRRWFEGEMVDAGKLAPRTHYADTSSYIDFNASKFTNSFRFQKSSYEERVFRDGVRVEYLGKVAEYATQSVSRYMIDTETYVTTACMNQDRKGITRYEGDAPASDATKYSIGNTLVSRLRPNLRKLWYADRDGTCSKEIMVIRPKNVDELLPEFLYFLLWQDDFFDYCVSTITGISHPRADKKEILKYRIPLPSVSKQRTIVIEFNSLANKIIQIAFPEATSETESTRSQLEKQIKALEEKRAKLIDQFLADQTPDQGGIRES